MLRPLFHRMKQLIDVDEEVPPMIIGIGYTAGSGKDTVSDYLVRNHSFKSVAFADDLKFFAKMLLDLTDDDLSREGKKRINARWGVTNRVLIQKFGQGMRDLFGEDFWVNRVKDKICAGGGIPGLPGLPRTSWVIRDVRHHNELQAVNDWGGHAFWMDGPSRGADMSAEESAHISEAALAGTHDSPLWAGSIDNWHDKVALYANVESALMRLVGDEDVGKEREALQGVPGPPGEHGS